MLSICESDCSSLCDVGRKEIRNFPLHRATTRGLFESMTVGLRPPQRINPAFPHPSITIIIDTNDSRPEEVSTLCIVHKAERKIPRRKSQTSTVLRHSQVEKTQIPNRWLVALPVQTDTPQELPMIVKGETTHKMTCFLVVSIDEKDEYER